MKQKAILTLVSLSLGLAAGAFGFSMYSAREQAQALVTARAEGRDEARKADARKAPAPTTRAPAAAGAAAPGGDGSHFNYEYVQPKDAALAPYYRMAVDNDLLRRLPEIQAIDGLFVLPRPLHYLTAECREPSAFYLAQRGEVVMCYETMRVLLERGKQLQKDQKLDAAYPRKYLDANLRFILSHETGHALIDLLDIPVTGREEDAVDQLATTLMLRFAAKGETDTDIAANLSMAANWFLARSTGAYNLDAYADEHSLGEQRYFNLQCMLYGSDPVRYVNIVANHGLTPERAQGCPAEAHKISRAWLRLLLPYVAPKYEMTEAKANAAFAERERERDAGSDVPYLR